MVFHRLKGAIAYRELGSYYFYEDARQAVQLDDQKRWGPKLLRKLKPHGGDALEGFAEAQDLVVPAIAKGYRRGRQYR